MNTIEEVSRVIKFMKLKFIVASLFLLLSPRALAVDPMEKLVLMEPRDCTVEKAIQQLSWKSEVKIEILEDDLRHAGLTKYKKIKVKFGRFSVKDALDSILRTADSNGRLYYFVKEDGTVVVTAKPIEPKT